jgi:hypothetical protein
MAYKYLDPTKYYSLFEYSLSDGYRNFINNLSKVALLLTTGKKCENNTIIFGRNDEHLYSDMKRTIYHNCPDAQFEDMKNGFNQVLIEQSIVLTITSWECYFSDIIEYIFNDDLFIQKATGDNANFELFLKEFGIKKTKFNRLVDTNNSSLNSLNFGTFLFEEKKVSCQRLKDVKYIFKMYFDYINLEDIEKDNWDDIEELFKSRHSIIHNQDMDILSTYNIDEILKISEYIFNIISHVDEQLFTSYIGDILE